MENIRNQSLIEKAVAKLTSDERLDYILLSEAIAGMVDAFKAHYYAAKTDTERRQRITAIHKNINGLANKPQSASPGLTQPTGSDVAALDQMLFDCARWMKKTYLTGVDDQVRKKSQSQMLKSISETEGAVFGTLDDGSAPDCPRDFCLTEQGACIPCIGS